MKITKENIEAILYDYAEGNLSDTECEQLQQYLCLHPEYKTMLAEYDPSLVVPEEKYPVFDGKEDILSQTVDKKHINIVLISRYVKYISSIAAMFLLFFAVKSFYTVQKTQETTVITDNYKPKKSDVITKTSNGENKTPFHVGETASYNSETTFCERETTFGNDHTEYKYNQSFTSDENSAESNNPVLNFSAQEEYSDVTDVNMQQTENSPEQQINDYTPDIEGLASDNGIIDDDIEGYEDLEYRIIFINNKPTLWKRIKRWFYDAKQEFLAMI